MNASDALKALLPDLLAICAAADDIVTDDEVAHIRRICGKYRVDYPEAMLARLEREDFDEIVDEFCERCPPNPPLIRALYREACLLCLADDELDESEQHLLERMREDLDLTERFGALALEWSEAFFEVHKAGALLVEFGEAAFEDAPAGEETVRA